MNMNMDINWYEHDDQNDCEYAHDDEIESEYAHDDEINMDIPFLIPLYVHILHLQSGNMA